MPDLTAPVPAPQAAPATGTEAGASGATCREFLEWALPRLGLSWPGFKRVHRQVCRRIAGRLADLRLPDCLTYRQYLEAHPAEWTVLDGFCRISISRLVRERAVFERLASEVLPALAEAALARGAETLRCWSAGCASGEEPYSLAILWMLALAPRYPGLSLRVTATDVDEQLLERAREAVYRRSSLREVPDEWIAAAFTRSGDRCTLRPEYRAPVRFRREDLREVLPPGRFDLVLCRYVAFTYFDEPLRRRTLERLLMALRPGGALVIGLKERLPEGVEGIEPWAPELRIFRRAGAPHGPDPDRAGGAAR